MMQNYYRKRILQVFKEILMCLCLAASIGACAYVPVRFAVSIEHGADSIADSLSQDLRDVQGTRQILVSAPVDAVTYSRSEFSPVFQEFLTSSMAKRIPHVVDVHFRSNPDKPGPMVARPLGKDETASVSETSGIILVSTYLVREDMVIITTRAVDSRTKEVITSARAALSRAEGTDDLFRKKKEAVVYEQ